MLKIHLRTRELGAGMVAAKLSSYIGSGTHCYGQRTANASRRAGRKLNNHEISLLKCFSNQPWGKIQDLKYEKPHRPFFVDEPTSLDIWKS